MLSQCFIEGLCGNDGGFMCCDCGDWLGVVEKLHGFHNLFGICGIDVAAVTTIVLHTMHLGFANVVKLSSLTE
jgi:hypothetical protein